MATFIVLGDAENDMSATGIAEPTDVNIEAVAVAVAVAVVIMADAPAYHIASVKMNMTAGGIAAITIVSEGTGKKTKFMEDEQHCSRPQGLENFWWPETNVQG